MVDIIKRPEKEYWICIIGPANLNGMEDPLDYPIRRHVRRMFEEITGHPADSCFSGWGLTPEGVEKVLKAWADQPNWMDELNPLPEKKESVS